MTVRFLGSPAQWSGVVYLAKIWRTFQRHTQLLAGAVTASDERMVDDFAHIHKQVCKARNCNFKYSTVIEIESATSLVVLIQLLKTLIAPCSPQPNAFHVLAQVSAAKSANGCLIP